MATAAVAAGARSGATRRTRRWSVYLVRRADGALYAGIAIDVAERFAAHGAGRGAKALRGRGPLVLVWQRRVGDRGLAQRVEYRLKRLDKVDKERLVAEPGFARRWLQGAREAGPRTRA